MGSSASKATRAAGSAARKYPHRPSPSTQVNTAPPTSNAQPLPSQPQQPEQPQQALPYQPGPTVHPKPQASGDRNQAINLDASDPDFAQSLRSLGPVQPNPTLSPTSAFSPQQGTSQRSGAPKPRSNPAIAVLEARSKIQDSADREFIEAGRRGHAGREFLDIYTIRQILVLRDQQGKGEGEIERRLGLKSGVVQRLGTVGVVELAGEMGRAEKEVRMV